MISDLTNDLIFTIKPFILIVYLAISKDNIKVVKLF